nr:MAG TPA: InsA C-terminal domain [Caudoviricetes sp.]
MYDKKLLKVDIDKDKLEELYNAGLSISKIAKEFNVSMMTIVDRLDRFGIKAKKIKTIEYALPNAAQMKEILKIRPGAEIKKGKKVYKVVEVYKNYVSVIDDTGRRDSILISDIYYRRKKE